MSTIKAIWNARSAHMRQHYHPPNVVYLGREDYDDFLAEAKEFVMPAPFTVDYDRPMFAGLLIYIVDAKRHIHVTTI